MCTASASGRDAESELASFSRRSGCLGTTQGGRLTLFPAASVSESRSLGRLRANPSWLSWTKPTSALDVIVQARILRLLNELRSARGLTYIFITHDLAVVCNIADRVAVLKDGRLVELENTGNVFSNPGHPYTRSLIAASPVITPEEVALREKLKSGGAQQ